MSDNTQIEWTSATFNPWWGCTKISPGCDHCYAENLARRFGTQWGTGAQRREFGDKHWREPLKWNRRQEMRVRAWKSALALWPKETEATLIARGFIKPQPFRVFCASMADWADTDAPTGARDRLWQLIRDTPHLTWLLLTKRIGIAAKMLPDDWGDGYANVRLGATIVDQNEAERDVVKLLRIPAAGHFLSIEPMLGAIYLTILDLGDGYFLDALSGKETILADGGMPRKGPFHKVDWVIVGGESGRGARPIHPEWARSLRDECAAAGVAFFFKQWGEWIPTWQSYDSAKVPDGSVGPERLRWITTDGQTFPVGEGCKPADGIIVTRFGKKIAGRLLDGVEHNAFPTTGETS